MSNENKKIKETSYTCPICNNSQKVIVGETHKCNKCGATITAEDVKNQKAIIVKTNDGKKKFSFNNLIRKWWFWVAIGAIVVLIIGIACGSRGNSSTPSAVSVNEWASISDYQMRVISVDNTNEFGSGSIGHYTTQNNYICIVIELKNNSNIAHTFLYSNFEITNGANTYKSLATEAYWYAESKGNNYPALYLNGYIDGGLSGKYYLVFETADATTSTSYKLTYKYLSDKIVINL